MVDFLGGVPKKTRSDSPRVEYHVPQAESASAEATASRQESKKVREKEKGEVHAPERQDFAEEYLSISRKRWMLVSGLLAILAISAGGLWYVFGLSLPVQTTGEPEPIAQAPVNSPPPSVPVNAQTPAPSLPDTELAPLRGALVRFASGSAIYLVENNGELRRVVTQSVIFKNGQRMAQIDRSLIYLLPGRWESIRHGTPDVSGQVDFDPRVLTAPELEPFL